MLRGTGADPRFYRPCTAWVKPVTLLMLLFAFCSAPAQGDPVDELERARNDEERLGAIIGLIENQKFVEAEEALAASGEVANQDSRWINLRGLAAAGQGRHYEAIVLYESGLRRDPGLGALHRNLAISLVSTGVRGRALSEFRQATELDPLDVESWLGLCTLQIQLRRADGAEESLARLDILAEDDSRTWRARAALADLRDDRESSALAWRWLEEQEPDAESARRLGGMVADEDAALALVHYVDCYERDASAVDCRERASRLAWELDRPADAVRHSSPAYLELSEPGYTNLLLAASTTSAIADLEGWVERRSPASASGWGVVALVRRQDGRSVEAVEAVENGLALAESADLYNLLGVLRVESGDRTGAREAWVKALDLDPGHGPARANMDEHPEGP